MSLGCRRRRSFSPLVSLFDGLNTLQTRQGQLPWCSSSVTQLSSGGLEDVFHTWAHDVKSIIPPLGMQFSLSLEQSKARSLMCYSLGFDGCPLSVHMYCCKKHCWC